MVIYKNTQHSDENRKTLSKRYVIRHKIFKKNTSFRPGLGVCLLGFGLIDIAKLLISTFKFIRLLRRDFTIDLTPFSEGWKLCG